ncbi:MAG: type IX secretion system outer membrane channel protein PorV [Hydrotalea flava]|nr:type IX secretion system outer membrane channel protein PorV [Hydrotalea flava]NIM37168.1 type IX secretion system outer membrane channel protein PorV [Hydrotalea flava]NIN02361.1 type IX secretion system outer membrane channel protein PorV [Hydrotalea flava]NIN14013.1 type IX secretion system outer membrane channel protein PorV [Hydrotalea flava]NIO93094.1 type IX secretion system outer membrane channel protein PorV [Hydrotalea flava]
MRIRVFFLVLLLCIVSLSVFAQTQTVNVTTTAVPFLRISSDARASGMGDVGIATSPDANGMFWNRAKLPFATNDNSIAVTYSPWFKDLGLNDVYLASIAGYHRLDNEQVISASVRYFSLGNIQFADANGNLLGSSMPREFGIDFGYSRKLSSQLGIGVALRYINSSLASGDPNNSGVIYKAGSSVAGDATLYHIAADTTKNYFTWGVTLSNLGSKISYTNDANIKDYIPANLGLGAAYTARLDKDNKITFAVDLNKLLVPTYDSATAPTYYTQSVFSSWFKSFNDGSNQLTSWLISAGAEYNYDNTFFIRTGYFYENKYRGNRNYLTFGLGLNYQNIGINLSYLVASGYVTTRNPLSNTIRIGLNFDLANNGSGKKNNLN